MSKYAFKYKYTRSRETKMCRYILKLNDSKFTNNDVDKQIDVIRSVLLKEYELCFTRACSMYDLTNEIIKLYTTIYFAVVSVFGFVVQSLSMSIFGQTQLLPICMLLCLIVYGYATMFMHISTWSARNNYRKRRSYLLQHLLGISNHNSLRKSIVEYLCIPRYVDSGILRGLSLYLWYFIYIILCNWIAAILLSIILFGLWSKLFWIVTISFLIFEWVSAEIYIILKKRSHKKKSEDKRKVFNSYNTFSFYDLPLEVNDAKG